MSPSTEKAQRIRKIHRELADTGSTGDVLYVLAQFIDENQRLRRQVAHLQSALCKCA